MPGRLSHLDATRGIAIVAVVFMHAFFEPWDGVPRDQALLTRLLYFGGHAAVPGFLVISGYLFAADSGRPPGAVLGRKATAFVVPAVVWSVVALACGWWLGERALSGGALTELLTFSVSGQYYFVVVLFALMAGGLALRRVSDATLTQLVLVSVCLSLAMFALTEARADETRANTWTLVFRNPLYWAPYFLIGLRAGCAPFALGRSATVLGVALTVLLAATYLAQGDAPGGYPNSYFGLTIVLFTLVVAVLVAAFVSRMAAGAAPSVSGDSRAVSPLAWLGRLSFPIYLVHAPFFIGFLDERLLADSPDTYLARVLARWLIGLGGALALVVLLQFVLPARVAPLLGISPAPRAPRLVDERTPIRPRPRAPSRA